MKFLVIGIFAHLYVPRLLPPPIEVPGEYVTHSSLTVPPLRMVACTYT